MTVAVAVKVFDGIALATDSATTLHLPGGRAQVYDNANKVFQLHRRLPVGAMTWGLGQLGAASIATVTKDFRRRLMGLDTGTGNWKLPSWYTIEQVAERLVDMVFDELYSVHVPQAGFGLGFLVAGYSAQSEAAEAWSVTMDDPFVRPTPVCEIAADQSGWKAWAQPEATMRLFTGIDPRLADELMAMVVPGRLDEAVAAVARAHREAAIAPMPFVDALNFARFLVDVTAGYTRYLLGPDTVGGPVQIAGITRHEGFKWVQREHYYREDLNPRGDHEHDRA